MLSVCDEGGLCHNDPDVRSSRGVLQRKQSHQLPAISVEQRHLAMPSAANSITLACSYVEQ